jgi:hypothetical protein
MMDGHMNVKLKISIAQTDDNTGRTEILEFSDNTRDKLVMLQVIQKEQGQVASE